jgi:hypothetical protein
MKGSARDNCFGKHHSLHQKEEEREASKERMPRASILCALMCSDAEGLANQNRLF